jgi:Ni/Fe-hydrogenase subunit HybB-like protein
MCDLDAFANIASILTALIAAGASVYLWCERRKKINRLAEYLKKESGHSHTVVHLMANLGMTEAEILHASFASRHVVHKVRKDYETGLASQLLFEYSVEEKRS